MKHTIQTGVWRLEGFADGVCTEVDIITLRQILVDVGRMERSAWSGVMWPE